MGQDVCHCGFRGEGVPAHPVLAGEVPSGYGAGWAAPHAVRSHPLERGGDLVEQDEAFSGVPSVGRNNYSSEAEIIRVGQKYLGEAETTRTRQRSLGQGQNYSDEMCPSHPRRGTIRSWYFVTLHGCFLPALSFRGFGPMVGSANRLNCQPWSRSSSVLVVVSFHETSSLRCWLLLTCSTPMARTSAASCFNCSSTVAMR